MTYFLEHIASALYKEFGNTLNRHALVFPNRRAGLYFLKYLASGIDKPVWSPSILTINDLFRSYSSNQIAGNEILLFELYKVYSKLKKQHETFDEFYFWGDMLLNDFDDVDKYLVDASLLFRNVSDIKNIDSQFGGLTDYQIEIIKRFWTNFEHNKPTDQKSGFISIWSILYDIYIDFRAQLNLNNIAYEGMIFREFAENPRINSEDRWDIVHFIGFNALNECEKVLMKNMKKEGKARFYWDFDNSYMSEGSTNSAGYFMRENLKMFGNDMPEGWSYDTMLSKTGTLVTRKVIETSSDVAQVKLIQGILGEIPGITSDNAHHTAIVLADENLLMPVLTSLPENMGDINITMGLPLKHTLVYTLLRHLMDLQRNTRESSGSNLFNHRDVISIIRHSLLSDLLDGSESEVPDKIVKNNLLWVPGELFSQYPLLSRIFTKPSSPAALSAYFKDLLAIISLNTNDTEKIKSDNKTEVNIRNEFIYRVVLSLNRLEPLVAGKDVLFTTDTYMKILDRMLRTQSVPFSGEPLSGIQIMGILETRALDFKNLVILSVNEGILPSVSMGSSFIPFTLREAFGLPSVNHQESIYAFHFFRLMQRAENVTLVYNSNSEGLRSGEMSRFIIQMSYDEILKPVFQDVSVVIKTNLIHRDTLKRTDFHISQLESLFLQTSGRVLSPSAINTWLFCRMKFFYRYINQLKEPDTISSEIDPAMMGNILHDIMKSIYLPFTGHTITSGIVDKIIEDTDALAGYINEAVNEKFRAGVNDIAGGNELIVKDVLKEYVLKVLNTDKYLTPLVILYLENSLTFNLPFIYRGHRKEIPAGGKADRIDILSGVTRIVDYKTGTVSDSIGSISDLFVDDRKKDSDGWLQTLLYCEAYLNTQPGIFVRPSLYKIKKLNSSEFSDKLRIKTKGYDTVIEEYSTIRDEFMLNLSELVTKIFSDSEPFVKTSDARGKCIWCPYRILCAR